MRRTSAKVVPVRVIPDVQNVLDLLSINVCSVIPHILLLGVNVLVHALQVIMDMSVLLNNACHAMLAA